MSANPKQKLKLLYLLKILMENTDEDHPLSATNLLDMLSEYHIAAERKSIYSDIRVLLEYGYDIIETHSPKQGWFIASRDFELPEVRLLVDAVLASTSITPKKSKELISKLKMLTSSHQWTEIERQVYMDSRIKQDNEEIFYNIDELQKAISERKRVDLKYYRRVIDETCKVKKEAKTFTNISPYGLAWVSDHYYLICNNSKYDNLMHLRVDRIKKVIVHNEPVRPVREVSRYLYELDVADYINKSFNMFGGELQSITIRCPNTMIEEVADRFGCELNFFHCSQTHFTFTTMAMVSTGLISWLLQFEDIEVIKPLTLRQKLFSRIQKLEEIYNQQ